MGIFGATSIYDADIEKATSENNTSEKWDLIMEICDKVGNSSPNAKECLRSIIRRLNHTDPHVVVQAITLLDACISNCGKSFHLEVASRDFETEFKRIFAKTTSIEISTKLKMCLKRWADTEFKSDPQLNLIPSLYQKMKSEGHDFNEYSKPIKREVINKDPNVVSSQQEQDDIAKAIELSLKEVKVSSSPKAALTTTTTTTKTSTSTTGPATTLYPSMDLSAGAVSNVVAEPRKVRALYDFEAAEDNELTFFAGEVLLVLDDTDPNWWKGQNTRGEGLFPANFVTADLSAEPDVTKETTTTEFSKKKVVQFEQDQKEEPPQINEDTIDRLLHLLHEADPEDPSQDSDDMLRLENMVNQMGPLIDAELDRVDRKHGQLTQLSVDFGDAVTLYHSLMRDDRFNMHGSAHMSAMPPYSPYHPTQNPMPPYGHQHQYGGGNGNSGPASFVPQNGIPNGPLHHGSPLHHQHQSQPQQHQQPQNPGNIPISSSGPQSFPANNFISHHAPTQMLGQQQYTAAPAPYHTFPQHPQFPTQQLNSFPGHPQPNHNQQATSSLPHQPQSQQQQQPQMMYQQQQQPPPQHPNFNQHHHASPNHQSNQTMIIPPPNGGQMPQHFQQNPNIPLYQQQR